MVRFIATGLTAPCGAVKPASACDADAFDRRHVGSTSRLRRIEGAVGGVEKPARAAAVVGPVGDADARADAQWLAADAVGRDERGEQMIGKRGGKQR